DDRGVCVAVTVPDAGGEQRARGANAYAVARGTILRIRWRHDRHDVWPGRTSLLPTDLHDFHVHPVLQRVRPVADCIYGHQPDRHYILTDGGGHHHCHCHGLRQAWGGLPEAFCDQGAHHHHGADG